MRIRLSAVRSLAVALIWGGLLSLPAFAAGSKSGGAFVVTDDLVGASAGTVGASGGTLILDGTLSPVAASTSGIAGAPFTGSEAGYLSMMTTTPVNSSFLPVSSKTLSVQWSVSNPTGTLYMIDASTMPDFTGTVFSAAIYNSSVATLGGLHPDALYYVRYKANYMEGDETAFHPLGSTRTLANLPAGCAEGFNVRQDGFGDYTGIQLALNALPTTLTGHTCVVIKDGATYNEQVTVEGFTNNGSSITIQAMAGQFPVVQPPAFSTAAFMIFNASVNIQGISVAANQSIPYGVWASSAYVTLSSVSVGTSGGLGIYTAGVRISSWSAISYSSVAVGDAHGYWLDGSTGTTVNFSTAVNNSAASYAVFLDGGKNNEFTVLFASNSHASGYGLYAFGSDTNTVTGGYLWGGSYGAGLYAGCDYNAISLSTMISKSWYGLYAENSDSNTVTQSHIEGSFGFAAMSGADYNVISLSTMIGSGFYAVHLNGASSNTVTQSYLRGLYRGAQVEAGANSNTISFSALIGDSQYGLYASGSDSNTVTQSYMWGGINGASLENGANYNTISLSTAVSTSAGAYALYVIASVGNTISQSVFTNTSSTAAYFAAGADNNTISRSTMTGGSQPATFNGAAGLVFDGASTNTVIDSVMNGGRGGDPTQSPGGHGLYITGGSSNTVTRSIMSGGGGGMGAAGSSSGGGAGGVAGGALSWGGIGLYLNATTSNTISQSYMFGGGGGNGAAFGNARGQGLFVYASSFNAVSQSVMSGGGGGGGAPGAGGGTGGSASSGGTGGGGSAGCCDGAAGSHGVYISTGSAWNTLSQNFMYGGGGGAAGSTNNAGIGGFGLYVTASTGNIVVGSRMNAGGGGGGGGSGGAGGSAGGGGAGGAGGSRPGGNGGIGASLASGSLFNAVSQSTMTGGGPGSGSSVGVGGFGLSLSQSSTNTVTQSSMWGSDFGAVLDTGADYNAISFSTMIGNSTNGLYLASADSNTVTQSYMWGNQDGVHLDPGSDYNAISFSTLIGNSLHGIYFINADTNTVTQSYMRGGNNGIFMDSGADNNTVSLSTMTSNSAGNPALFFFGNSSNTILTSYVQGSTAAIVSGSTGTIISSSVLIATNTFGTALSFSTGGVNLTVTSTTLRGGPSGRGLWLDAGHGGVVAIGSVTFSGGARGIEIDSQMGGFALAIDSITFQSLTPGATAIHFLGGTFNTVIRGADFSDATIGANVSAAALSALSSLTMAGHAGIRTGAAYENDPNSVVGWEAGPYPGCVETSNVGAGQPHATITAGLAALSKTMTGHECVVVRDGATYNERVVVSGFDNGVAGSSITIMADPATGLRPTVSNFSGGFGAGAFEVRNASVNIAGIQILPGPVGISYGILVSSAHVKISSVNIDDQSSRIDTAGISLSSWTMVENSSVSVTALSAAAYVFSGGVMSSLSYSTGVSISATQPTLSMAGASSAAVTGVTMRDAGGIGAGRIQGGGYNHVSLSSFTSLSGSYGFAIFASSFNRIDGSYMSAPNGFGAQLSSAHSNDIAQSTFTSAKSGSAVLYLTASDSNTFTGINVSNPNGYGLVMNSSSRNNTVSFSTITSGWVNAAVFMANADSNTITTSFIFNPTGDAVLLVLNSRFNTLSQSTIASKGAGSSALWLSGADSNTVTGCVLSNPAGIGTKLDAGADGNVITQSSMTGNTSVAGTAALSVSGASSNTVMGSYIYNASGPGVSFGGSASSNSIRGSWVQGSTAVVVNNAQDTVVSTSVLVSGDAFGAALVFQGGSTNLSVTSSTLQGGASGRGLLLDVSNYGTVAIGSVTVTGSARGLEIDSQMGGFLLAIDSITFRGLTAGATAIHYLGGIHNDVINLASFEDSSIGTDVSGAALGLGSLVALNAYSGLRSGPTYEDDPSNFVFWRAGPYPGCAVTSNVGPGEVATSVSAGVGALPKTLTGHSCVVVRDVSSSYPELVSIEGFTNGGSSITIMTDPALGIHARVRDGFFIRNASVNITGIDVYSTVGTTYGIWASSSNVAIASVAVVEAGGPISVAGVALADDSRLDYSTISVFSAHGLRLDGLRTAVAYSTVTAAGLGVNALYIAGGSSNSVTQCFVSNPGGTAGYMTANARYNHITQSRLASATGGAWALNLDNASYNTISQSVLRNTAGGAVRLAGAANGNDLSQSTMAAATAATAAVYLLGVSSNAISGSYIENQSGEGLTFDTNADYNGVSQTTVTTLSLGDGALNIKYSQHNSVTGGFMTAPSGWGAVIRGAAAQSNSISLSTITSNHGSYGALFIDGATANALSGDYIENNSGTGAFLTAGASGNTISQSTLMSSAVGYSALQINTAVSNIVMNSFVQGSTAAYIVYSTGTMIGGSALTATGAAGHALRVAGGNNDLFLSSSVLTAGAGGAGVYLDYGGSGRMILSTNTIVGGKFGVHIATQTAGAQVWLSSNTILPLVTAAFDTYGLAFDGLLSGATVQNNSIYYRTSGTMGSYASYALGMKTSAGVVFDRNRIDQPGMISGAGSSFYAAYLTDADNITFKFNDIHSTAPTISNAFLFRAGEGSSALSIRNNVFVSSFSLPGGGRSSGTFVLADAGSLVGFSADYNDYFSSNSLIGFQWGGIAGPQSLAAWQAATGQDAGSVSLHPRWVEVAAGKEDFHHLSHKGRWNGTVFVNDGYTSGLIDAADPGESYSDEVPPFQGSRANLGSYGDTAEASLSPDLPPAPAVAAVYASSIAVSFGSVGSRGFAVDASTASDFTGTLYSSVTASGAAGQLAPQSLAFNTTYFLRLDAVWGEYASRSSAVSTVTLANTPAQGSLTFPEVHETSMTVSWSANSNPPDVTRYVLALSTGATYPNTDAGNAVLASTTPMGAVPTATLTAPPLSPNTTYYAFAAAINHGGVPSAYAALGSTATLAGIPLPAATTFSGVAMSSFSVSWNANGNPLVVSSYTVQLSTASDFNAFATSFTYTTAPAFGPSFVFGGLDPSQQYYFRVQAINHNGVPTPFAQLGSTVTLPITLQAPPISRYVEVNTSSVTASWGLVLGATGYTFVASPTNANPPALTYSSAPVGITATSATVAGLAANTTYFFFVQANGPGAATAFTAFPATATLAAAASVAAVPFVKVGITSMTVSWVGNNPVDVTTYTVVLSTGSSYPNTFPGNMALSTAPAGGSPTASFTGLRDNTQYYLHVAGVNHNGVAGDFVLMGSTITQISAPTALVFDEISSNTIIVSAYAPSPLFSNLNMGLSGTNLAKSTVYSGWHSEQWVSKAAMSPARTNLAAAALDGKVYVFGGLNAGTAQTAAQMYDPVSDAWTALTAMPTARGDMAAAAAAGRIYVVGGSANSGVTALSANEEYDPQSGAWSTARAGLATPRSLLAAASIGGKVYAFGGLTHFLSPSGANEVYDPVADLWTSKAVLSPTHYWMTAAAPAGAMSGLLYAAGGDGPSADNTVYDSGADGWTPKAAAIRAVEAGAAASLGGKIYVIGGGLGIPTVLEYDPAVDTWTARAPMLTGRTGLTAVAAGGRIYAIGGSVSGPTDSGLNEEYDPGVATKFAGLTPNSPYSFKGQSRNQAGTVSAQTVYFTTYTWAAVPSTATPGFLVVAADSVTVSWTGNGNPGGTEYQARASTAPAFRGGAQVFASGWGVMTSSGIAGLAPNTTYYFQAQARNAVNVETLFVSLAATVTLAALPSAAPATFSAVGTAGLTASWLANGNPIGITTYTVVLTTETFYPNSATGNQIVASTVPAGTTPTATIGAGLSADTSYYLFVAAYNHAGVATSFASLGSTSTLALPPGAVSPAFTMVEMSSVSVVWSNGGNPVGIATYTVVLTTGAYPNANAGNVSISTTPAGATPAATLTAPPLSANTTYFAYAAAVNWNGMPSAFTLLGATATLAAMPDSAASTFSAVSVASFSVNWSANGNPLSISSYTVEVSTASDFNLYATSVSFTTAPAGAPSATFSGLVTNTDYFFRVRAVNHNGVPTGYALLGSTRTTIQPIIPPAASGFVEVGQSSITATWGVVTGATGYTLVASLDPTDPPVSISASSTTYDINETTATVYSPALAANTTYYLFVRSNGPLSSSGYTVFGATSTLAATPDSVVTTFTAVNFSSFTLSWSANGNPLAITTYTVEASTASDFNLYASSVSLTTAPTAGPAVVLSGLMSNSTYYVRVQAINHDGVRTPFTLLGSTLTHLSPLFPLINDFQTGDVVWRGANTGLYNITFDDVSGSHLTYFQVKASTVALGAGPDLVAWSNAVTGISPADSYNAPWPLPAPFFDSLQDGVTNYISVKVFNGLANSLTLQDAFYVLKDTTPPALADTQTGDSMVRSLPGTTYTVVARDPASSLASFQYSVSLTPGAGDAALVGWTDIALVGGASEYALAWSVDFTQLLTGATNYVSVRAWDIAGTTAVIKDAFYVLKDTVGPTVAMTSPSDSSFIAGLTQILGTAASPFTLQGTEIALQETPPTGFYWDPAGGLFNSAGPVWMGVTSTGAWTLPLSVPLTDGATYLAVARSSTTSGIYSTTYASATFVVDMATPTVGVTTPLPDSTVSALPLIAGTAADPGASASGVASVEVRLRRNTDGQWWNWFTESWGAVAVSTVASGTTGWSLAPSSLLVASLSDSTSYYIAVSASDFAQPSNQGGFFVSGATFTWQDTTPPAAVSDLAAVSGSQPGRIDLSWTGTGDDGGAGTIYLGQYRIFYSTDIAAVASTATAQVIFSTAMHQPGSSQLYTLTGLDPGGTYYVKVALDDGDGNWSAFSNQASTVAAPAPFNAITGHVVDLSTQGITAVQVDCWDALGAPAGTTFTLADGSGTFSVTDLAAGSYKLRVTWTVNGVSSSLWQDGIAMGSSDVDFTLEIDYSLATLTGTLATLTTSSPGRTGGLSVSALSSAASNASSHVELFQNGRQVAQVPVKPSGRWSISNLLPGKYAVRAYTGMGYTDLMDVELVEGEIRTLGFVFDPLPEGSVFAFPNPARTSTTIRFATALWPLEADILIFDLAGNLVKEFPGSQILQTAQPEVYHADWDLTNSRGQAVASGVYLVMVRIKGGSENQKAKVIKKLAVVR